MPQEKYHESWECTDLPTLFTSVSAPYNYTVYEDTRKVCHAVVLFTWYDPIGSAMFNHPGTSKATYYFTLTLTRRL
jgi:hypothetical protein